MVMVLQYLDKTFLHCHIDSLVSSDPSQHICLKTDFPSHVNYLFVFKITVHHLLFIKVSRPQPRGCLVILYTIRAEIRLHPRPMKKRKEHNNNNINNKYNLKCQLHISNFNFFFTKLGKIYIQHC